MTTSSNDNFKCQTREKLKENESPSKSDRLLIELKNGNLIGDYKIKRFIAKNDYGGVYEVCHINTLSFALKAERRSSGVHNLKMDVTVLRNLQKLRSPYFCRLHYTSSNDELSIAIMTLVGKNLSEIRQRQTNQKFSKNCSLNIGIQCLNSIQLLHSVGFLHRDIKPANFCVSLDDPRQIVMVDFGLCRKFVSFDGKLRHPRWHTSFKGTYRYSALAAHYRGENSRKDDIESWFYMIVELIVGTLPWYTEVDEAKVAYSKQLARTQNLNEFLSGCPKELIHILIYIDKLTYYDSIDYSTLRGLLSKASAKLNKKDEEIYDWIIGKKMLTDTDSSGSAEISLMTDDIDEDEQFSNGITFKRKEKYENLNRKLTR